MIELRRAWFPAVVLAVTVVELVAAVVVPGVDQFDDKGWAVRLVVYPALMLAAPAGWWLTHRGSAAEPPYFAFGLLMLPFLSDTTANWLDLFRRIGWWDDLSHAVHWALLGAGLGLLLAPSVRPRWVLVPLVGGIGAMPRHRLGAGGVRAVHPRRQGGRRRLPRHPGRRDAGHVGGPPGRSGGRLVVVAGSGRRLREASSVEGSTGPDPDVPSKS